MRQGSAQNSDRPPRGASRACRATTTRGASGGLLILISEDSSRTAISGAATDERTQAARRAGPRRNLPR
jgi:hypothetical protein